MDLGIHGITLIGLAILISSIVQGAVGFAVALIAIPLFLQAGLDLPQSILVVLICSMVQNAVGLQQTWRETPIKSLSGWAVFRALLIPIGFGLMQWIESYSKSELRQLFGFALITVLILQLVLRIKPQAKVHWGWTGLAMSTSGVGQGMIGTPGPPIAFWVMAHNWNSSRSRGAMFFLFVTGAIPHLILLLVFLDRETITTAGLIALCGIPISFVGCSTGLWIGNRFDRARIKIAIFATLIVLSLNLVLMP